MKAPDGNDMRDSRLSAQLTFLRGAIGVSAALAVGLIGWITWQAIRHPDIQAALAGNVAPLWIPLIIFVAVCMGFLLAMLMKAYSRVANGEDLFAKRHRRRRGDSRA